MQVPYKSWDVLLCDKKVPTGNLLLFGFPNHISSSNVATELINAVHGCIGNPDEKFVSM